MFRIYDGREAFYQWDLDRKLIVEDSSITEVHFCNRTAECALPVATYKEGNLTLVNVPNLILQESFRINVYAYDGEYTKHSARFDVIPRSKPDTYVYTETEIKTWDELFERIEQIEENGVSDEHLAQAIEKYFEENDINVDLTGYATEQYVQEQIGKIEIPEVDLTGYATEDYVKQEITKAQLEGEDVDLSNYYTKAQTDKAIEDAQPDLSGYAKKSEIPSTTGLATETYVDNKVGAIKHPNEVHVGTSAPTDPNVKIWVDTDEENPVATKEYVTQKINEAELGGGDVDLSNYYTKAEVDAKIPEDTDLSNYYTKSEVDEKIAAAGGVSTTVVYDGDYAQSSSVPYHTLTTSEAAAFEKLKDGEEVECTIEGNGESVTFTTNVTVSASGIAIQKAANTRVIYMSGTIMVNLNGASPKSGHVKITKAGSESADVDLSNYYTKAEVDELIAASGTAEEVIWEDTLDPNGDSNELSDDEVAKLIEVSDKEVSITLKNHDDNSEITFTSNVYYDEYGSTLEFQGVEEATDGLLGYLYVYTDSNMLDAMLSNDSQKADIKIFLPGQRDYYTREEADSKMQSAITTALSAIGVAEEGAY